MNYPARKIQNTGFEKGQIYSLQQIAGITTRFKSKTFLSGDHGMFYLYQNQVDKGYWIGGPFEGESSNLFLFLGQAKCEKEMKKLIQSLRPSKKKLEKPSESSDIDSVHFVGFDFGFSAFLDHLSFDFDVFDF